MFIKTNTESLIVFLLASFTFCPAFAQERAATILKIANLSSGEVDIVDETPLVKVKGEAQQAWQYAKKNKHLFRHDFLSLARYARVKVKIKGRQQDGTIAFVPHPDLTKDGNYQVKEATDGSGRIAIEIQQGSSIVTIVKGELEVITQRLRSVVRSSSTSRALYHVRDDGTGEIYLQMGTLRFPDNPEADSVRVGQAVRFNNGQITQIFTPGLQPTSTYLGFIETNNATIWKTPLWRKPGFWLGATAVAAGAGVAIIAAGGSDENMATGTITVSW